MIVNPYPYTYLGYEIPITQGSRTNLIALGDSITVGQNAAPSSNAYINLFRTAQGFSTLTNMAVGGRGIWNQTSLMQGATFTRSNTVVTCLVGLNDIRRNGAAAKTLRKIEAGVRSLIIKCFGTGAVPAGGPLVTRSGGSFVGYAANTVGGLYGTGTLPGSFAANCPNTIGASFSYTFTGTAVGVQMIASDGVISPHATCDITIDGVLVRQVNLSEWYDGLSDGVYDNKRGPVAFTFHDLTNASHTITVTATSNGNFPVDFFSTIQPLGSEAAMIFSEIPYLDSTGYATSPAFGSVQATKAANILVFQLVNFYKGLGFNIGFCKTNDYYDLATGLDTADHIHPNNTGHSQINNAFAAVCL